MGALIGVVVSAAGCTRGDLHGRTTLSAGEVERLGVLERIRAAAIALIAAVVVIGCSASPVTPSPSATAPAATATPGPAEASDPASQAPAPTRSRPTPEPSVVPTPDPKAPLGYFDAEAVALAFSDALELETVSSARRIYRVQRPNVVISFTTEGASPATLVATSVLVPNITLDFSPMELGDLVEWRDMMNARAPGAPMWFSQQMSLYLGHGMVLGDTQEVRTTNDVGYRYLTFSLTYPEAQAGEPTPGFPQEMILSIEVG